MNTNNKINAKFTTEVWRLARTCTFLVLCVLLPDFAQAQYSFARLHQFTRTGFTYLPNPIEGSDGMLYGTVSSETGTGYAYRLRKDGTGFQTVFNYGTVTGGVFAPLLLFEASNAKLYGFAEDFIGPTYRSLLYRMNKDGTTFEVLRRFPDNLGLQGGLDFSFETPDGWLYGYGGSAIFRCRLDGGQFAILHMFGSVPNDGEGPSQFIFGSDERIYGTCGGGGSLGGGGTIYRIERDGTGYGTLHEFQLINPAQGAPWGPLGIFEAPNGGLVGLATGNGEGATFLYNLSKDGSGYTNVLAFGSATQGATNGYEALAAGRDGFLYGRTIAGGQRNQGTAYRVRPSGKDFTILYHFGTSSPQDRGGSWNGLVFGRMLISSGGDLYGTSTDYDVNGTFPPTFFRLSRPRLQFTATRVGTNLQLTATGTTNTNWRLESRDTMTGTNAWQPFTNITLGPNPTVIQQPLDFTNRFYRGAWPP